MSNLWVREKEGTNFGQKLWLWRRNEKNRKRHKFAEVCLYSRIREFFTIRTKMALARPILKLNFGNPFSQKFKFLRTEKTHCRIFYLAATATFFDQNWCSLFLWPTNCSYFMCMKWHQFWSILGFARSESLGGVKSSPPVWIRCFRGQFE